MKTTSPSHDYNLTCLLGFIALQADKVEYDQFTLSLIVASKRMPKLGEFLGKTKFFLYAVIDGMAEVLSSLKCGILGYFKPQEPYDGQMSMLYG